jgi:PKD repeat protein
MFKVNWYPSPGQLVPITGGRNPPTGILKVENDWYPVRRKVRHTCELWARWNLMLKILNRIGAVALCALVLAMCSSCCGQVAEGTAFDYLVTGEYTAKVRVTDDGGLRDIASIVVSAGAANQPPTADLQANPTSGATPLVVDFDASASADIDGSIVDYEWDLDGDGNFSETGQEADARGAATTGETYIAAGTYNPVVRVTDNQGASDTATVQLDVTGNQPPVPDLQATPLTGDAPLLVDFDATASSDPDDGIADYEWDFDGDLIFNEVGSEADAQGSATGSHTYNFGGTYNPTVRVFDVAGASATAKVEIVVNGAENQPPVAALTADPTEGASPLFCNLDAGGSSDPDGTMANFEWDIDGDGLFGEAGAEEKNAGMETGFAFFQTPGVFTVSVRVTDDLEATDEASAVITVT